MEQKDPAILDRFKKNPDGTWTCTRATSIKVGNRVLAINQGMTFTKGVPYLVVDVAEWLDGQSD